MNFNTGFIQQVKIEGWGKPRFGWFLGFYSNAGHQNKTPLGAKGETLMRGTIVTAPSVIANGQLVTVPDLYSHLKTTRFVTKDVARSIRQRRIDVYTAEGDKAKQLAYSVARRDTKVCM